MILFPPSRDKLCDKYYHARFIIEVLSLLVLLSLLLGCHCLTSKTITTMIM